MQATSASQSHPVTRVRVGVICHGEQPPPSLIEGLEREVIEAQLITSMTLDRTPGLEVLLLWLSSGAPGQILQSMTSWIESKDAKVGLIGCAPNGDIEDTIAAFEAGVDDFVAGRCGVRELASRIHSVRHRLSRPTPHVEHTIPGLTLDAPSHEVRRGDTTLHLSSTEVAVLRVLMDAKGRTLSRAALLDRAWGDQQFEIGERAVDNVILRLRRKLGTPQLIETVRGVGFRLSTELHVTD